MRADAAAFMARWWADQLTAHAGPALTRSVIAAFEIVLRTQLLRWQSPCTRHLLSCGDEPDVVLAAALASVAIPERFLPQDRWLWLDAGAVWAKVGYWDAQGHTIGGQIIRRLEVAS